MFKDYLLAQHRLCVNWHSGQWSKGYELLCLTNLYLEKWYRITNPLSHTLSPQAINFYNSLLKHKDLL